MSVESERLDRIERHLELIKSGNFERIVILTNIENALVGSSMNGNKGLVHIVKELTNRVEELEDMQAKSEVYSYWAKIVASGIILGEIAIRIKEML